MPGDSMIGDKVAIWVSALLFLGLVAYLWRGYAVAIRRGFRPGQWGIEVRAGGKVVAVEYQAAEVLTMDEFEDRFGSGPVVFSGAPGQKEDK